MNAHEFAQYLKTIQRFAVAIKREQEPLEELTKTIQDYISKASDDPIISDFLKGEQAYYSGQYENALKFYLKAKTISFFPCFCFRASAAVSSKKRDNQRAMQFAKKALQVLQDDYPSLIVLHSSLKHLNLEAEAGEVIAKIAGLEQNIISYATHAANKQTEPMKVSLAKEELDDLTHLFEMNNNDSEENYCSPSAHQQEMSPCGGIPLSDLALPASLSTYPENSMSLDKTFFSSRQHDESEVLTSRLYPPPSEERSFNPVSASEEACVHSPYASQTSSEINEASLAACSIEGRIETFQQRQTKAIAKYIQQFKKRGPLKESFLNLFSGWSQEATAKTASPYLLTEQARQSSCGYYIRWNNQGIVINPGKNFLTNFHEKGLNVYDINYVIITQNTPEAFQDIKRIYDHNYQLNKHNTDLHLIQYYLNQKAYQELSRTLKPNFKQERNTIHCLEIFQDSPDVERIELSEGIALNYFQTFSQENNILPTTHSLGLRLDLKSVPGSSVRASIKLGYVTGTAWSPLIAHHLGSCDVLIAGFGHTNANDYNKVNHNEDCLGYFGTYSLLEEIQPKLLLATEFNGKEGDLRIEVCKKLREEMLANPHMNKTSVILPADNGMYLDLKSFQIQCSVSHQMIDPSQIKVTKSTDLFGQLCYLAPHCLL